LQSAFVPLRAGNQFDYRRGLTAFLIGNELNRSSVL
jgi:hypothetical protein